MRAIYSPQESLQIVGTYVQKELDGGVPYDQAVKNAAEHYKLKSAEQAEDAFLASKS